MIKIVMTLDVCAFLYSMLLLVVYFSKKRIKSFETSIFSNLILVAIISIALEFLQLLLAVINFEKYFNVLRIISHLYVFSYFIMILFTTSYIILKLYMVKVHDGDKIQKLKRKLIFGSFIISIVFYIIIVISVLLDANENIIFDGDSYYGQGISVIFMVICYIVLGLTAVYALFFYRKNNTSKDKIFYICICLLLIINGIFRIFFTSLMINNIINVFIIAIMFFTIENPDFKLINELKEANNAKDNFLSSMSHEMKTPLNAIIGLSSIEDVENFKDINKEANVLFDIVNNVIDTNSFDINKIRKFSEVFNIKNSLSSVIEETKNNIAGKPILFTSNIPDINIKSNSEAIVSICDRILSNSYKFTEQGFISFNITVDNNILNINVKDSGKGISEEQLTNIFNKFNRKKEDLEGTVFGLGLGLSLVKSTVDALYGTIDIKSEIDKGTEVIITIPIEKGN